VTCAFVGQPICCGFSLPNWLTPSHWGEQDGPFHLETDEHALGIDVLDRLAVERRFCIQSPAWPIASPESPKPHCFENIGFAIS